MTSRGISVPGSHPLGSTGKDLGRACLAHSPGGSGPVLRTNHSPPEQPAPAGQFGIASGSPHKPGLAMLTTCMVGYLQEHRLDSGVQKAGRSRGLTHTVIVVAKLCEHVFGCPKPQENYWPAVPIQTLLRNYRRERWGFLCRGRHLRNSCGTPMAANLCQRMILCHVQWRAVWIPWETWKGKRDVGRCAWELEDGSCLCILCTPKLNMTRTAFSWWIPGKHSAMLALVQGLLSVSCHTHTHAHTQSFQLTTHGTLRTFYGHIGHVRNLTFSCGPLRFHIQTSVLIFGHTQT